MSAAGGRFGADDAELLSVPVGEAPFEIELALRRGAAFRGHPGPG